MHHKVSAPGSIMLMGEHAVLHGEKALVAAVDARVAVSLSYRSDQQITIDCQLGQYQTSITELNPVAPFDFVLAAILQWRAELPMGFDLVIESCLTHAIGLGSSTAVVVAVTAALADWLLPQWDDALVFERALAAVRYVQGGCSGADVAASVYGGVLAYRALPFSVEPLAWPLPWVLLHSGKKMKTADVLSLVAERFANDPEGLSSCYQLIGHSVQQAIDAVASQDETALSAAITANQQAMVALGVCDDKLAEMIAELLVQPHMMAAKISGAGLGDCVIGFGAATVTDDCPYDVVMVEASDTGVRIE